MDAHLQSYEDAPYPTAPVYQTHPDALATPAFLAGLSPPPVERCRVLEIGCGTGGNLLAMASVLPESQFVGVDLSPRQIALAQEMVDELRLTNVKLYAGDLRELVIDGEIDYLICHGVFSWCPPPVQERILELCREQLAPSGVAYISYNALPGWRRMGLWRDLMLWGASGGGDWRTAVSRARRTLEVVAQGAEPMDPKYAQLVREGVEMLRGAPDSYLVHEFLETYNEPFLFREMVVRAAESGLQYLAESCRQLDLNVLPAAAQKWVRENARDRIAVQQCVDFVQNTSFRRSLFCRGGVTLDEALPERIVGLHMNALCEPVSREPDVASDAEVTFRTEHGQLTTDIPLVKTILVTLWRAWPRTLTLPELGVRVREQLGAADDPELSDEVVAETALHCYRSNLLALHLWTPRFTSAPGERPLAHPLARAQARRGLTQVSNLRHREVSLNLYELALLEKLDGTRDRAALVEELVTAAAAGRFVLEKAGQVVSGADAVRALMAESLPPTLQRMAHGALLIS